VDEYLVLKGAQVRPIVLRRDKGVCAKCGADCLMIERVFRRIDHEAAEFLQEHLGIPRHRIHFWDADHIVPVVEGGGACGLDNFRTLCWWCHIEETAALAKRRAMVRRDSARTLLAVTEAPPTII